MFWQQILHRVYKEVLRGVYFRHEAFDLDFDRFYYLRFIVKLGWKLVESKSVMSYYFSTSAVRLLLTVSTKLGGKLKAKSKAGGLMCERHLIGY